MASDRPTIQYTELSVDQRCGELRAQIQRFEADFFANNSNIDRLEAALAALPTTADSEDDQAQLVERRASLEADIDAAIGNMETLKLGIETTRAQLEQLQESGSNSKRAGRQRSSRKR